MGMITGFTLYFIGYESIFGSNSSRSNMTTEESFRITAQEYGDCERTERGCGSFRLSSNRDYRFIRSDRYGDIKRSEEGLLSNNVFSPLVDTINRQFQQGSLGNYPTSAHDCIRNTQYAMQYRLEIKDWGTLFVVTCDPDLAESDPLLSSLSRVSEVFPF